MKTTLLHLRRLTCLLPLLLSAGAAHADVLIDQTFESYTDNQQITTGAPWTVSTSSTGNYVEVLADAQSSLGMGTRGINFYHGSTNANGLIATHAFAQPVTTGTLTWSFDFRMPDPDINANVAIRLIGGTSANTGPAIVFERIATGNVYAWSGQAYGNGGDPVAQLSTDEWYHAVVAVDLDARQYSLSLQGGAYTSLTAIFSDYNFYNNTSVSGLTAMQIATNNSGAAGGDFYLDNLFVSTVPEPAAWATLAGALVLPAAWLGRRNRRD